MTAPRDSPETGEDPTNESVLEPILEGQDRAVAIYHWMMVSENFEQCAARLYQTIARAAQVRPGARRHLYIDIEGHRNRAGGYDDDAYELLRDFVLGFLRPYVAEITTPLYAARNPHPQVDEIPEILIVSSPPKEKPVVLPKPERRTSPSLRRIVEHLGLDEAICLVCRSPEVERAHIVPMRSAGRPM